MDTPSDLIHTSSYFPLYDQIYEQYGNMNAKLDQEETTNLLKHLRSLDKDGAAFAFVIIRIHCLRHNLKYKPFDPPYSAEKHDQDDVLASYKFDLKFLPHNLQRMLLHFCHIHNQSKEQRNVPMIECTSIPTN